MGAVKGQVGYLRFFVEGDMPDSYEVFEKRIAERRFVPINPDGEATESAGWVPVADPHKDDLPVTRDLFSLGEYIVVSYREDKVSVPNDILRKAVDDRVAKMIDDGEDEKKFKDALYRKAIKKSIFSELKKKAIKKSIFSELKKKAFPKTKVVEVIWDTKNNVVRICAKGALAEDRIASLFERTFGVKLTAASYPVRTSLFVENDVRRKKLFEHLGESISAAVGGAPRQNEDREDCVKMDAEITADFLQQLEHSNAAD